MSIRKNEIAKAKNSELVAEFARSYSAWCTNYMLNRGTKQVQAHCNDVAKELVKRGLLTEEDVKKFNE